MARDCFPPTFTAGRNDSLAHQIYVAFGTILFYPRRTILCDRIPKHDKLRSDLIMHYLLYFERVIQTFDDPAFGHHAPAACVARA
jgi:hypothetical protein